MIGVADRLRFRPRERRLALIAAAAVVCWMVLSLAVQPLWDLGQTVTERVAAQRRKLEAVARLLAQGPVAQTRAQALAAYLAPQDAAGGQAPLLAELEQLSRTANVSLNLKPRPAVRDGQMSRQEVELDLEGPQQGLLAFIDSLVLLPRLLTIERLRVSTIPAKPHVLRANLLLHQLSW